MNIINTFTSEIRWADIDANFHVRHSVYYDWAANSRIQMLGSAGITMQTFAMHKFGPVIFREEAKFLKELHFGNSVNIAVYLSKLKNDYTRFSFYHEIAKPDGTICATVTIDGAWINTELRKVTVPPQVLIDACEFVPKTPDFEWIG